MDLLVRWALCACLIGTGLANANEFDHSLWHDLLQKHVVAFSDNTATAVDYQGFKTDNERLQSYLDQIASVDANQFAQWPASEQLAFLINAYNAGTVALILTEYPDLQSIRDLGSLFRSPWQQEWVSLFGATYTLDDVEHHMIRGTGGGFAGYQEPRIHFAVNCASVGCPALLPMAYTGENLEALLDKATRAFLSDSSRNRWTGSALEVSSIFRWYKDDFTLGWQGVNSLEGFLADYATELGIPANQVTEVRNGDIRIRYLSYDWQLNSLQNSPAEVGQ